MLTKDVCSRKDDATKLYNELNSGDGIVVGTPVFDGLFPPYLLSLIEYAEFPSHCVYSRAKQNRESKLYWMFWRRGTDDKLGLKLEFFICYKSRMTVQIFPGYQIASIVKLNFS